MTVCNLCIERIQQRRWIVKVLSAVFGGPCNIKVMEDKFSLTPSNLEICDDFVCFLSSF